jgi:UDP-glucose 4-epimerase
MKVVVTGGSGQLGTAVLERLVAARKVKKIVSLDLVPPVVPSPRIDWRIADMRDPGLERHLEGADALIHLAFLVAKPASVATMRAVNVEGSQRIFEAAAQHGVRKIVYSSSVAAYGIERDLPVPVVETTPRRRSTVLTYAENKWEVEEYLDGFETAHPEVAVVRLRPGILLGRRVNHMGDTLLKQRLMPVMGSAKSPLVWDEDVADAVFLALMADVRGAYNLCASNPLTGDETAALAGFRAVRVPNAVVTGAARATGVLAKVLGERRLDAGWLEAGSIDVIASAEKARTELGWKPKYPTSGDVAIAFGKMARRKPDRRISIFLAMVSSLAGRARQASEMPREAREMSLSIHLDVTGPDGGDYALHLAKGVLSVKSGIPRPPDSTITLSSETLLELLSGKTETSTASMVGKIRVRGEPIAGLVIGGIVNGFRRATEMPGARGKIATRLSRWFGEGESS